MDFAKTSMILKLIVNLHKPIYLCLQENHLKSNNNDQTRIIPGNGNLSAIDLSF